MLKTLKFKFIVTSILFIVISVGTPTYFLVVQMRSNFADRSIVMLQSSLDVIRECIKSSMMDGDKNLPEIIQRFALHKNIKNIRIFNREKIILYASDTVEVSKSMNTLQEDHIGDFNFESSYTTLMHDENIYSVVEPINNTPACQTCHDTGEHIAYIDIDTRLTESETKFYTASTYIIYLGIAIIIVLFLGLYFLFCRFINKPLQRVIKGLDEVDQKNLDVRLPEDNDDEFGMLNRHFNKMVSNLQKSRKKIEMLHFEALQRADRMVTVGELAAEMAHEINNPAAIISSRADYLSMETQDNEALKNYTDDFRVILDQIHKVSRITGNILKYSKRLPKQFKAINLRSIAEGTVKILESRFDKNGIRLIKDFRSVNSVIRGDGLQIEQLITNLINNAIDAMAKGGTLRLIIEDADDEKIRLTISDDGPGIEDHVKDKIFSPFFTTKSADKGTGLGLYIVKNICNNHDAEIECYSEPGEGTRFVITINKESQTK